MSFLKNKNESGNDALMAVSKSSDSDTSEASVIKEDKKKVFLNPDWLRHWQVTPKSPVKFLSI